VRTMLDRFRRSSKGAEKADRTSTEAPLPSAGPDEETVRIARKDFRKRRNAGRWRLVRRLALALLVVGLVAGSVWVVFFSSYVTAREVDVVGSRTIPGARIERAANIFEIEPIRNRVSSFAARLDFRSTTPQPATQ